MKFLDIGEVAKTTGIAPSTLRYYDDEGLIESVGRHGLRRQFDPNVILQLTLINMGKTAGFSLVEIKQMLTQDGAPKIDKSEIAAKAKQLDKQIAELTALRDTLNHVAECPAPSHMECDAFRRLVSVASKRLPAKNKGKKPSPKATR